MEDVLWTDLFKCEACGREVVMIIGGEKGRTVSQRAKEAFRKSTQEVHGREDCSGKREVEPYKPGRS